MDRSAFLHHGTGIPKEIAFFFALPDGGLSKSKPITLESGTVQYSASIQMDDPLKRFRLFWKSDFSNAIQQQFPEFYAIYTAGEEDEANPPQMRFQRLSADVYSVDFLNSKTPAARTDGESSKVEQQALTLNRAARDREYINHAPELRGAVIFSYLAEGLSHRELDEKVLHLDREYSRGYQSMGILHYLGIRNEHKGVLEGKNLMEAIAFCRADTPRLTHLIADLTAFSKSPRETEEAFQKNFEAKVAAAKKDSSTNRKNRLRIAPATPETTQVLSTVYKRNVDVIAEVLSRANGFCELCAQPAPFIRKKNGEPYLEVHHTKQLSNGGEDTVENAVAVCPNCHRNAHYGA
jgi:5-methylcytosine-specific restriction protein A